MKVRQALSTFRQERKARRAAREGLLAFTTYTKPDYATSWHHELICDRLDAVVRGECRRLMVFTHPRSGKSELASRRLPAYFLGRRPDAGVIACSYSSDLAGRMNRDVQRIMDGPAYKRLFPETTLYGKNVRTVATGTWIRNSDLFEVVNRRGSYRSAGVGAGVTGMGADLILVDDYLKSAAEARSQTIREGQWEWFNSDLYTRQMPGCAIVIICTRWHHDDIPGRLLRMAEEDEGADRWEVIRLPAISGDMPEHERDRRGPGEALWPDRYGLDWLNKARSQLGPYAFEALYQQNPTPREGGLFTAEGLSRRLETMPLDVIGRVRYWDKGYSSEGDWTAGVLMAKLRDGTYVVEDVARLRAGPRERNDFIKAICLADDERHTRFAPPSNHPSAGKSRRVLQVIEQPPGAGSETTAQLVRELAGHAVQAYRPVGSKEERAEPLAAQCGAGNVTLVKAPWNAAFVAELLTFPNGENDDQLDGASGAFNHLAGRVKLSISIL